MKIIALTVFYFLLAAIPVVGPLILFYYLYQRIRWSFFVEGHQQGVISHMMYFIAFPSSLMLFIPGGWQMSLGNEWLKKAYMFLQPVYDSIYIAAVKYTELMINLCALAFGTSYMHIDGAISFMSKLNTLGGSELLAVSLFTFSLWPALINAQHEVSEDEIQKRRKQLLEEEQELARLEAEDRALEARRRELLEIRMDSKLFLPSSSVSRNRLDLTSQRDPGY